jgi:hypothetical protein
MSVSKFVPATKGGGIIRSKIFRFNGKSRLIKAIVVMRLEFRKRSALKFFSRISNGLQAIGNYPRCKANRDTLES